MPFYGSPLIQDFFHVFAQRFRRPSRSGSKSRLLLSEDRKNKNKHGGRVSVSHTWRLAPGRRAGGAGWPAPGTRRIRFVLGLHPVLRSEDWPSALNLRA